MYLKKLSLFNFKNITQVDINFSPKINCFVGNNGVGKTNILDSIYLLAFCKSFINPTDNLNIKQDENTMFVQGVFQMNSSEEIIYYGLQRGQKKQFKKNKKSYDKLSDHLGFIPLVIISPIDIKLIMEGSEERRKLIDRVISQYDKKYLESLLKYNKILAHRNKLLKHFAINHNFDRETISIWDEQLIIEGNYIYQKRVDYIKELIPIFKRHYKFVSKGKEEVGLIYESKLHHTKFEILLEKSLEKDKIMQYTTAGIHKDDISFLLLENSIKKFGSQGQKKTYLIALKLAQFDFIKKINNFKPILLLDDIFDMLDVMRVEQIVNLVADNSFGQIFITDTNKQRLDNILKRINIDYKLSVVENGELIL